MATPYRVLIVKLLALGDVVMASTLIGAIRRRWPDAHITWVTGQRLAPLVSRFAGVDCVIPLDEEALLVGRATSRVVAMARAWRTIGRGGWQLGIVAHADRRYAALLALAGVRETRIVRAGLFPRGPLSGIWMGHEYARLVSHDFDSNDASVSLATLQGPAPARTWEVLLAPGGARNLLRDDHLRRWPLTHWVRLAAELAAAGERVCLVGTTEDQEEGRQIVDAVPQVENAIGQSTLSQFVDRIATARLLVTHDSGPLHLAALTRTPTVALFGPTNPIERLYPGAPVIVVSAASGLPCAPCYDGRNYAPCLLNRCLTDVPVESVLASARRLLDDTSAA